MLLIAFQLGIHIEVDPPLHALAVLIAALQSLAGRPEPAADAPEQARHTDPDPKSRSITASLGQNYEHHQHEDGGHQYCAHRNVIRHGHRSHPDPPPSSGPAA